jgi:hypothetical protein
MSDYDEQLEAERRSAMDDDGLQSCSVMGAAAPMTPSQIPVDPFGIERPGDWALPESEPPGFEPGNPLPVRPNEPLGTPQSAPEAPQVEPGEPIPETLRSPGAEPPGAEPTGPEVPVEDAPTSAPEPAAPEAPVEPGPETLRSPGVEASEGGEAAAEGGEAAVEGGEAAVEGGEAAVEGGEAVVEGGEAVLEGGEVAVEGAELAEGGAALGELAPVAAAGVAGYALGSAIAPYVYGDKNLDGSPVTKMENVSDIDPNYKDTWAYKINQWLDD